jgi:hypothetical protein
MTQVREEIGGWSLRVLKSSSAQIGKQTIRLCYEYLVKHMMLLSIKEEVVNV